MKLVTRRLEFSKRVGTKNYLHIASYAQQYSLDKGIKTTSEKGMVVIFTKKNQRKKIIENFFNIELIKKLQYLLRKPATKESFLVFLINLSAHHL